MVQCKQELLKKTFRSKLPRLFNVAPFYGNYSVNNIKKQDSTVEPDPFSVFTLAFCAALCEVSDDKERLLGASNLYPSGAANRIAA